MNAQLTVSSKRVRLLITFLVLMLSAWTAMAQSAHVMGGVGPIDQAMSGAGMALPQDALTALHWNPAAITTRQGQSLDVGLQLMMPTGSISSTVNAGAFGPQMGPSADLVGTTESTAGPFPIPSVGFISNNPDSRFAYGLSVFGVGGFGVDYELSTSLANMNPILTPQMPEGGMGFGALSSSFMLMQMSPTFSMELTDKVSIGVAPTFNLAQLELSVFPATAPTMLEPQNPMSGMYPDAPAAWATGFGFQNGLQATPISSLNLGVSFKSPQWFNEFNFDPTSIEQAPDYSFRLDYPMIVSGALAWTGLDGLLLAADVRYIDFSRTEGFSATGFNQQGAVQGFGWESITVVALGAQYELTPSLPVRLGWAYNESPVQDDVAFFNAPAPAIVKHHLSGGFSYKLNHRLGISFAAQYGIENSCEGVWKSPMFPGGENPYTSVRHELSTLTIIGGLQVAL